MQDWWTVYGDDQLNALVAEGVANAPDLKRAEARLREADATAQQSGASLLPKLTANGSLSETRASLNQGFPAQFQSFLPHGFHDQGRVTGDLSYDLDLFGKNRAAFAAATSEADAVRVDLASARLSLSSAIASAYANLVQLTADRAAGRGRPHVRKQSEDLLAPAPCAAIGKHRRRVGSRIRVPTPRRPISTGSTDRSRWRAISSRRLWARGRIAAWISRCPPIQNSRRSAYPPIFRADLIGRRPDIVAARLRAMAASKRIDVAHADFYPNINLTGYAGYQALGIRDLLTSSSLIGQLGPAISLPIFDGGRIEGAYRGARAQYDEAVATYDQTLTTALREVADALANQRELGNELAHSRAALAASEDAYRVTQQRYDAGLSRYLEVLTSEDTLVTQRKTVADLQARAFVQDVALVRALGGGFHMTNTNVAQAAKE